MFFDNPTGIEGRELPLLTILKSTKIGVMRKAECGFNPSVPTPFLSLRTEECESYAVPLR